MSLRGVWWRGSGSDTCIMFGELWGECAFFNARAMREGEWGYGIIVVPIPQSLPLWEGENLRCALHWFVGVLRICFLDCFAHVGFKPARNDEEEVCFAPVCGLLRLYALRHTSQ